MTLNEYQEQANKTAIYPKGFVTYPVLGLAGEAGELAQLLKKSIRDNHSLLDENYRGKMMYELGDVLWYVAEIATSLGISLDLVAVANLEKLARRKTNNALNGSGDNR